MSAELLPGIVEAVADGRMDDALTLAEVVLEDLEPAAAVVGMAGLARVLHGNPGMSVRAVAAIMQLDNDAEIAVDEKTTGAVIDELLAVVEARAANNNEDTPESESLLKRFDYYPGSADLATAQVSMVATLLRAIELQHSYKAVVGDTVFARDPEQINAAAVRFARAVFTSEDPGSLPKPFSAAWD